MTMKLKSLKAELKRLSDVGELKKELNRLASEARSFDLTTAISPASRALLEKRYKSLHATVTELQTRIDVSFEKLLSLVRKNRGGAKSQKTASTKRKAPRAVAKKTVRKAKKKTARRS